MASEKQSLSSLSYANRGNIVTFENRVRGHQRQPFNPGLGQQDTVERITVVRRQNRHGKGMNRCNGETLETAQPHSLGHVDRRRFGQRKLPDTVLDDDFPYACRGQVSPRGGIGQSLQQVGFETSAFSLEPEPAVRIDKKPRVHSKPPAGPRHVCGACLISPLEHTQEILIKRVVEIVWNHETSLVDAEDGTALMDRDETGDRLSRPRDDDIFPFRYLTQQTGQMSLGFMDGDLMHGLNVRLRR